MNKSKLIARTRFVVRRVAMIGLVTRKEVVEAFGLSATQATRVLNDAVADEGGYLRKGLTGRHVEAIPGVEAPGYASLSEVLVDLLAGRGIGICGVSPDELGMVIHPSKPVLMEEYVMGTVVKAIRAKCPIGIIYAGMRRNEVALHRIILPWRIELHMNQWRCIAWDFEKGAKRTFLVARIQEIGVVLHSSINQRKINDAVAQMLQLRNSELRTHAYRIHLNPELTADQRKGLRREIGATHDVISLTDDEYFWFSRHYVDAPIGQEIVWPPIIRLEKV